MSEATFLVCVNDKEHSRTALRFACMRAKKVDAHVTVMCVVDPVDYNTIFSVGDLIKEERIDAARQLLDTMREEAEKFTGVKVNTLVREGLVSDAIIETIETDNAINMLVIGVAQDGSSSKGGLLQQLTQAIGDKFHIPLMLVPGNLTDTEIEKLN